LSNTISCKSFNQENQGSDNGVLGAEPLGKGVAENKDLGKPKFLVEARGISPFIYPKYAKRVA